MRIAVVGSIIRQGLCAHLASKGAFHINTDVLERVTMLRDINLISRIAEANKKPVVIELRTDMLKSLDDLKPDVVVLLDIDNTRFWKSAKWKTLEAWAHYTSLLPELEYVVQSVR